MDTKSHSRDQKPYCNNQKGILNKDFESLIVSEWIGAKSVRQAK